MRIVVNGQTQERQDDISVARLIETMSLQPRRVAVELNRQIVRRADFGKTQLADSDELEIVTLVGGG